MRIQFLKATVAGLILSANSIANAGLIHNDYEWLDFDLTSGMTRIEVENTILNQVQYKNYKYASVESLNNLFISLVDGQFDWQDSNVGWKSLSDLTEHQIDIFNYLSGGDSVVVQPNWGWPTEIAVRGWVMVSQPEGFDGSYAGGNRAFGWNPDTDIRMVFDRSSNDISSMYSPNTITNWSGLDGETKWQSVSHLLVSEVKNVPEPSSLAIFALGVIGLASRRFKKQS